MTKEKGFIRKLEIKIRIADANVGFENDILKTIGLGSCVAVMLYDRTKRIGGLLHFMLPKYLKNKKLLNEFKYCDTGMEKLIERMNAVGTKPYRMEARIVGGANMFDNFITDRKQSIGYRNIEASRKYLQHMKIPIVADDTGGNYSRSVEFILKTGIVKVSSYRKGELIL